MNARYIAIAVALPLILVACDSGPSPEQVALQSDVDRLTDELETARASNAQREADLDALRKEDAALRDWVQDRKEGLAARETELLKQMTERDRTIDELNATIARLKEPAPEHAPEEGKETPEQLHARMQTDARQLRTLGVHLYMLEEFEAARAALLLARQLGDDDPEMLYVLARASARIDDDEAAEKNYQLAIEGLEEQTDDDHGLLIRCLMGYGLVLQRLGEPREAEETLKRVVALDDRYAPVHYNLGLLYRDTLKDPAAAEEAFRRHVILGGSRSATALEIIRRLRTPAPNNDTPAPDARAHDPATHTPAADGNANAPRPNAATADDGAAPKG